MLFAEVESAFQKIAVERLLKTAPLVRMTPESFSRWLNSEFSQTEKALVVSLYTNQTMSLQEQDAKVAMMLAAKLQARATSATSSAPAAAST